jgi:hypothetical protein
VLRGDWVFNRNEESGIKLTTTVSTPVGDKVLGFVIPDGTDLSSLLGVVMGAEEDALSHTQKFVVDAVTDPDTQVDGNEMPANVVSMKEWKEKRDNEQAGK